MKPIPVDFHIGPLQIHTYGIGLAVTFWFAFRYFERRLRKNGYPWQWLTSVFLWIIVAAIVGARAMHVLANLGYYTNQPIEILAVWHGGLSSFGGLILAVPTGILLARKRCPSLPVGRALDLVAPVLMAAWALGRLLGPQLMVAGGGHPTHQWFGMYYADQIGKRVPVPIFQAIECAAIFVLLLLLERALKKRPVHPPNGMVIAAATCLWGIARFFDEYLWLSKPHSLGSHLVEAAGIGLAVVGFGAFALLWRRYRSVLHGASGEGATPPAAEPVAEERAGDAVAATGGVADAARQTGGGAAAETMADVDAGEAVGTEVVVTGVADDGAEPRHSPAAGGSPPAG